MVRDDPDKKRRVINASGFLSGVLAVLHALSNTEVLWPPDQLWSILRGPQRLELGAGLALMLVFLTRWVMQRRKD